MSRGVAVLVVALVTLSSVAPVAAGTLTERTETAGQTAHGPTIGTTINGENIPDGGFTVVREGARLQLEVGAPANASLDSVIVRVNGNTVYRNTDPDQSVTIERTLPVSGGNNTVRVIAEGTNDAVATRQFRVYLETLPPALDLESPVDAPATPYDYPTVTTNETRDTVAGEFEDFTGFRDATVSASLPRGTTLWTIQLSGENQRFEREMVLRYPRTRFSVETADVLGNRYFDTFDVRVVDDESPDLELNFTGQREETPRYRVRGGVEDNVWVKNVTVTVWHFDSGPFQENRRDYTAVGDREYERSTDRLEQSFEQDVRLLRGRNLVAVFAHDHEDRQVVRTFTVEYFPDVPQAPTIDVAEDLTRIDDDQLDLQGLVSDGDGDLQQVYLEVQNRNTSEVTDVETIRLRNRSTYELERRLNVTRGTSEVRIEAVDSRDNRTTSRFFINTSTGIPRVEPGGAVDGVRDPVDTDVTTLTPPPTATPVETPTTPSTSTPLAGTVTAETDVGDGGDRETGSGENGQDGGPADGDEGNEDSGEDGLLATLLSPPVLAVLAFTIIAGSVLGYRRMTRV